MIAAIIFVVCILTLMAWTGHVTAKLAARRGRSRGLWFALGSIFFPLPSILLVLLPAGASDRDLKARG